MQSFALIFFSGLNFAIIPNLISESYNLLLNSKKLALLVFDKLIIKFERLKSSKLAFINEIHKQ